MKNCEKCLCETVLEKEIVQSVQGKSGKPAQKSSKRRRTKAEKVGRLKYILQRIKRLELKIDGIDLKTRTLMAGLREWMSFEPSYIQKIACEDEIDVEIIARLVHADEGGVLPSAIARDLPKYRLRRWDVTRRIQHMNRKLQRELGKKVAEKRGYRWAMTSFMRSVWGAGAEEAREEMGEMER